MRNRLFLIGFVITAAVVTSACAKSDVSSASASPTSAAAKPKLGIRPHGDEELQPDLTMIKSDELKAIYTYIDDHIDDHVENLQRWIQQPSISNSGEGIPESAEMVKGFFEQLGCQESRVYDVGLTEFGSQANPVVYAKCDEGAPHTLLVYWMYDTMPVTQPDVWVAPPFEGRLVEQAPFKKVLIGRGATNTKGPQMEMWNALMSIKAVAGRLPVNLVIIAEGDEERMSIGARQFMKTHAELFKGVEALWQDGGQSYSGRGGISGGGSEGCVYVEITTSGAKWGRGPTGSDIHGGNKRSVDSPAWRHIKAVSSLVSLDGNTAMIDGFYYHLKPLTPVILESTEIAGKYIDLKQAAANLGVARFIAEDPVTYFRQQNFGTSFNLDGIWGGNMYAGGAGAILPNKITSKHNIRYQPDMEGFDLVEKLKKQLVKNGYPDVEVKMIGDVPWRLATLTGDLPVAQARMLDTFKLSYTKPKELEAMTGGYWPAYLFGKDILNIPISGAGVGMGGRSHAANEFLVIEGAGQVYGMAGAEKALATVLYNYAGKNQ
jgi:acetylornithine deacetylase/succinyl-diaminopimelate desuccinylase-like protein